MTLYTDELQKAYQAGVNSVLISQNNLNQPGESGPYQDLTGSLRGKDVDGSEINQIPAGQPGSSTSPYPKETEGRKLDKKNPTYTEGGPIDTGELAPDGSRLMIKGNPDLPNFLNNINIKPQDLLKILQFLPALGGFQLQNAKATPGPAPVWPGHKWPGPTPGQGPLPNPYPPELADASALTNFLDSQGRSSRTGSFKGTTLGNDPEKLIETLLIGIDKFKA